MAFGLSITGFVVKTLTDLKDDLTTGWRNAFGPNIPVGTQSVWGRIIGIMSERFAELWEQLQALYSATDPANAQGQSLEVLCALTGTYRLKALPSSGNYVATGTSGTLLAAFRVVSVTSTGVRFQTLLDATITTVPAWASGAYSLGAQVTNAGNIYQCVFGGTSTVAPTGTGMAFATTGSALWTYCGVGTGAITIAVESQDTGPWVAVAGSLVNIQTAVSGWLGGTNVFDLSIGRDVESDPALRLRRVAELTGDGAGAVDAIRAQLLRIALVTAVSMFSNTTDTTDGNGLPPHSVMALVTGGSNVDTDGDGITDGQAAIAAALWRSAGGGIATFGSTTIPTLDSEGRTQVMNYQVPTAVPVYIIIDINVDASLYPVDGDAQVQAKLAALNTPTGRDAVARFIGGQSLAIPGVLDFPHCYIGIAPSPTLETTIAISVLQQATFDTSRITVNSTPVTP